MSQIRNGLLLATLCCAAFINAYALSADQKEPMHIVADSSIFNYKTGVNLFEGHVVVIQGTTHLTADRLITKNNEKHKINEAIAYGLSDLAHYWTVAKKGDPEIHAKARVIKFYPIQSNVTLEKEVTVLQGDNSFQGELISYNAQDQTITVPALEKNRAILIYNPDN